jgi:hypothetical protein
VPREFLTRPRTVQKAQLCPLCFLLFKISFLRLVARYWCPKRPFPTHYANFPLDPGPSQKPNSEPLCSLCFLLFKMSFPRARRSPLVSEKTVPDPLRKFPAGPGTAPKNHLRTPLLPLLPFVQNVFSPPRRSFRSPLLPSVNSVLVELLVASKREKFHELVVCGQLIKQRCCLLVFPVRKVLLAYHGLDFAEFFLKHDVE